MSSSHIRLGLRGELAAMAFYEAREYDILEHSWSCRFGEIDLIVMEGTTLVFCEVKTRRSTRMGFPEDSISRKKCLRYIRAAEKYCTTTSRYFDNIRFDVISIVAYSKRRGVLRWIPGAFFEN